MLCAVVATSGVNKAARTKPIAKAPPTMLIKYKPPAILASWRGERSVTESIMQLTTPSIRG
jgi:hypothetical protein